MGIPIAAPVAEATLSKPIRRRQYTTLGKHWKSSTMNDSNKYFRLQSDASQAIKLIFASDIHITKFQNDRDLKSRDRAISILRRQGCQTLIDLAVKYGLMQRPDDLDQSCIAQRGGVFGSCAAPSAPLAEKQPRTAAGMSTANLDRVDRGKKSKAAILNAVAVCG